MDILENVTADYTYPQKPEIICLCGSTRFKEYFLKYNKQFTLEGKIVLMPGVFAHSGDTITTEEKEKLDKLHKAKIMMSDYVFIINKDNYIGESTQNEIEFALSIGIPVFYMEDPT